jgi:hypothetical protein
MQQGVCRANGKKIKFSYKEHIRYIRSNNSTSAYATHILDNRHEYGKEEHTKTTQKMPERITHGQKGGPLYTNIASPRNID